LYGRNLPGIKLLDHVIIGEVPYAYRTKKILHVSINECDKMTVYFK